MGRRSILLWSHADSLPESGGALTQGIMWQAEASFRLHALMWDASRTRERSAVLRYCRRDRVLGFRGAGLGFWSVNLRTSLLVVMDEISVRT